MSKRPVEIYDTTLRDGTQGEGVSFSVADKLRVAEKLDAFGVHYVEGGWPGSNPKDIEFFKKAAKRKWKHTQIAAFGSTRRKKIAAKDDPQVKLLVQARTPVVTIFGKTWLLHVKEVLRTTPKENLAMIADTIAFLKKKRKMVIYDAEHALDGYKDDPEYALATWKAAEEAGADFVVLCDTNGGSLPSEVAEITAAAREQLSCNLGIHTHNDIGLGVANALAGVNAGATQVQGTINGYGERTGNCNLTSVIPNIALKMGRKSIPKAGLKKLRDLSRFVDEVANLVPDRHQPWVGGTAFAHKGGMHVNAVQKVAHSFEHINPNAVGNKRRILVSDLAGRSNIVMKAQEMGIRLDNDTPEIKGILAKVKEQEHLGYDYEGAEGSLALLIRKALGRVEPAFHLEAYHVSMRGDSQEHVCEAAVKVKVGDKTAHTVADGDGPVNALDQALRNALRGFYPVLKKVRLTDYKVRILNSGSGTAAKTRVLIESTDGKERWYTVGVNENIIEASLQALLDSIEFRLLKK
jgi:2-isopropylmalate synthase|tara:strand:+ start:184 stop:1746 length:1563 start_codon:yes stop_codon:yes gene_type:complete